MKVTGQRPVTWHKVMEVYHQSARVKDKLPAGTDTVQISPEGQLIRELTAAATGDDIRAARVEAIRVRLAAGTYNVSAAEVADAILKELGR